MLQRVPIVPVRLPFAIHARAVCVKAGATRQVERAHETHVDHTGRREGARARGRRIGGCCGFRCGGVSSASSARGRGRG